MHAGDVTFNELDQWLRRTPVIADVHPLTPLCFSAQTRIISNVLEFMSGIDDRDTMFNGPTLILDHQNAFDQRFPVLRSLDHPPVKAINEGIAYHLDYVRSHLLTTHKIADYIESEVARSQPEVVVIFLVDGLSYADVMGWYLDKLQPCFVDGPSVTYRYSTNNEKELIQDVGFASIINRPSIFQRLYLLGYKKAQGYTYWAPGNNEIADYMFSGIPYERVINFESVLHRLKSREVPVQSYIQVVREGLDGLAHDKRELSRGEIDSAVHAIYHDIERLLEILKSKSRSVTLYVTADHGILWKHEHSFELIDGLREKHPRFLHQRPSEHLVNFAVRMNNSSPYYLLRYPYIGTRISANDCGVHGGLSYQESLVPFATFKG